MYALLKKELQLFLSSLTGLMVLFVFLTINGLLLFVFPSSFNIFDYGFASVEPFFQLAPFVFLFLIPALSMRSFAEERKIGTIEGLLSRPLTDMQIVLAKYSAILILLILALIPCLTYIYTVSNLADPRGNVDMAAFWGAYMGLFLLGACFASISLCMSSLT
ncbi:MAG: ABC transporter permease subunit, partial [Bacteroidales bacterium]